MWVPIDRLLSDGRPSSHTIARGGIAPIPFSRLRADVAAAMVALDGCAHAALACDDTYLFTVGLLALWQLGASVELPANAQPGTLAVFAESGVRVVDDRALANPSREPPCMFRRLDAESCRVVFHTSGSTGMPKRIDKTLGMLQRESECFHRVWGTRLDAQPDATVLATVTHQHLYGLAFRLLWPLAAGAPFDATTDAVWETLLPRLGSGAMVISSPAHLGRLAGIEKLAPDRRPALVFSAGAPLTHDAALMSQSILGCLPTEIFGSTETGAIATRQQRTGDEAWRLLPDTAIRLDDDGRMAVSSRYVDGWQSTEDVVERDGDGFRFLGRADRIVKIEGKRVSLPAVEAALEALPLVAAAAVVMLPGLPARLGGLLVLTDAGTARLAELGRFRFGHLLRRELAATLEPAGLPRLWRFTDVLPSGAMGKRGNAAIVARFAARPA